MTSIIGDTTIPNKTYKKPLCDFGILTDINWNIKKLCPNWKILSVNNRIIYYRVWCVMILGETVIVNCTYEWFKLLTNLIVHK